MSKNIEPIEFVIETKYKGKFKDQLKYRIIKMLENLGIGVCLLIFCIGLFAENYYSGDLMVTILKYFTMIGGIIFILFGILSIFFAMPKLGYKNKTAFYIYLVDDKFKLRVRSFDKKTSTTKNEDFFLHNIKINKTPYVSLCIAKKEFKVPIRQLTSDIISRLEVVRKEIEAIEKK